MLAVMFFIISLVLLLWVSLLLSFSSSTTFHLSPSLCQAFGCPASNPDGAIILLLDPSGSLAGQPNV